jgi:acyl carrier protein
MEARRKLSKMAVDAAQIGLEGTMGVLRKLLADHFGVSPSAHVADSDPLFSVGAGLTSLEGIEFLCEVEKLFDIRIKDLDWWTYETPTLAAVAQHVIDLTRQRQAAH